MKANGTLIGLVVLTALTVAAAPAGPILPAFAGQSMESAAPLVEHIVSPQALDLGAPDQAPADYYAWFNPTETNHQLLVYLPGGMGGVPANALLVQQQAAQLGYHVIGLMYVDNFSLSALCSNDPDPNSCFENAHFEIVYGLDTSSVVEVNQPNNIVNRLTKLLQYLETNPDTSGEGWSQFLADGHPNWSQIVVTGFSQGAGNAAMIAKHQLVARVVMFSGAADALPLGALPCQGADNWLSTHVTPSARYWGLAHDQDSLNYPHICANWDSLGMTEFGPLVQVETSTPPYGGTHMLFTDLKPHEGPDYTNAHPSTVIDAHTPLSQGQPVLAPAWQYMLTAPIDGE